MARDTALVVRALGKIEAAFRLTRLYPATHPALAEATDQAGAALAALVGEFPLELSVGPHGVQWDAERAAAASGHLAEVAGLLHAHGVRSMVLGVGTGVLHMRSLFDVATGRMRLDDTALGPIALSRTRRPTMRVGGDSGRAAGMPEPGRSGSSAGIVFRPDALPVDIAVRRVVEAVRLAADSQAQQDAAQRLATLAPDILARKDADLIAVTLGALDVGRLTAADAAAATAIEGAAEPFHTAGVTDLLLTRLGEARASAEQRAVVAQALSVLAARATDMLLTVYLATPEDARGPLRDAMRTAGERAVPSLVRRLGDPLAEVVAAAAELLVLAGPARAVDLMTPLVRHDAALVREAAFAGLARIGGGHAVARVAVPALKDESAAVRRAATRAVAAAGDPTAAAVLGRRVGDEQDEGVQAEMLLGIGRLGGSEALAVLARFAQSGGLLRRRSAAVRSAAVAALGMLPGGEARALVERYAHDKEPAVRRAAEAALR